MRPTVAVLLGNSGPSALSAGGHGYGTEVEAETDSDSPPMGA